MTERTSRKIGLRFGSPLTYPNFRYVWAGQFISQIGSAAHSISTVFFIKNSTHSGTLLGEVIFISGIGALLCLPFAGVLADKVNRKTIVILCDLLSALVAFALALAFSSRKGGDWLILFVVIANLLMSIVGSFFRPAFGGMFPDLVPRQVRAPANAMYKSGFRLGEAIGNVFGGAVYRSFGPASLFFINAGSFLVSAILVGKARPSKLFVPSDSIVDKENVSFFSDFRRGWVEVLGIPGARNFFGMGLIINFFATPIFVLMPFHVSNALLGDEVSYGIIMALFAAGVLAGYVLVAKIPFFGLLKKTTLIRLVLLMCFMFLLLAQASDFKWACVYLFSAGVANGIWSILFETALQSTVPRRSLGRVYAWYGLVCGGLIPIAGLLGGMLFDFLKNDTRWLFTFCAVIMTGYSLSLLKSKGINLFFAHLGEMDGR
ncbi:hypothetical protein CEG14_14760 [Bordetella genomosp. 1]|uniref:Major facilitator superfamily (MFS) profile domain-containing protein n=1 Tax=Bordetella genomosp. 1 TaxID=1395607 RepID=A0A261SGV4_9BORD|nr:MFS transporter [Bordetella genomosp. 1]OZI36271.1 hypothetical protein CEG14_14760 [Bordetella genomosp. 1]